MTLKGADLLAWAQRKAVAWSEARFEAHRTPLATLVAEVYLRGAIDALDEETELKQAEGMAALLVGPLHRGAADSASVSDAGG